MNRIFIGYDPRQPVSYTVLQHSITKYARTPVAISPIVLPTLPLTRVGLTPFTFSRFLVPWLCDFEGYALFLDIDMLVLADIGLLFADADPDCAVMVSKNKLRFEWTSVVLFNCAHPDCRKLTPEYVQTAPGLHKLEWTSDAGDLSPEWNHLVGYDEPRPDAKLVHFTQGVPCFPETAKSEYGDTWNKHAQEAMSSLPWAQLMGNSVHAAPVYERLSKVSAA